MAGVRFFLLILLALCFLFVSQGIGVDADGPDIPIITTVAGTGVTGIGGDGGQATAAQLRFVTGVDAVNADGFYIAAYGAECVRKVNAQGVIKTVAGTCTTLDGTGGYAGDGLKATNAGVKLNFPVAVFSLTQGAFLIADYQNNCIRKVDANNIISTYAGKCGIQGSTGNGVPATTALLNLPIAMAQAADGSILIADYGNACIRKVDTAGMITTVIGVCGTYGFDGDATTLASGALTGGPTAIAVQPDGSFLFADYYANRIRKVSMDAPNHWIVNTVAGSSPMAGFTGNGTGGYGGDGGFATQAQLNGPGGLVLTGGGGYAIADSENNRIRYVDPTGKIWTIAGSGTPGYLAGGYNGDNIPATSALLNRPLGIDQQKDGSILIADQLNRRIRKLSTTPPTNTAPPTVSGGNSIPAQLTCDPGTWTGNPTFVYQWLQAGTPIAGATGAALITSDPNAGSNIKCQITATTAGGSTVAKSDGIHIAALIGLTTSIPSKKGGVTIVDKASSQHVTTCPPSCTSTWSKGAVVTLYPFARTGYSLRDWTGPCDPVGLPSCTVTLKKAQTITANFVPQPTLSLTVAGQGSVSDSNGDSCAGPGTCAIKLDYGAVRLLNATPASGQALAGWTGCKFVTIDGRCAVSMGGDQSVAANMIAGGSSSVSPGSALATPNALVAKAKPPQSSNTFTLTVFGYGKVFFENQNPFMNSQCIGTSLLGTTCLLDTDALTSQGSLKLVGEGLSASESPTGKPTFVEDSFIEGRTVRGSCSREYCQVDQWVPTDSAILVYNFSEAAPYVVHVQGNVPPGRTGTATLSQVTPAISCTNTTAVQPGGYTIDSGNCSGFLIGSNLPNLNVNLNPNDGFTLVSSPCLPQPFDPEDSIANNEFSGLCYITPQEGTIEIVLNLKAGTG